MEKTKLQTLKDAAARQDWQVALRIAAKFADLGEHKAAITRGHEAYGNARFAAQLGRDPAADIEAGILALCARYSLNRDGSESTNSRLYGAKNNCIRAARKALGAEAQPGVHFTLAELPEGFTWAPFTAEQRGPQATLPASEPVTEATAVTSGPQAGSLAAAPAARPVGRGLSFLQGVSAVLRGACPEAVAAEVQAALPAPAATPALEPAPAATKAPRASSEAVQAKRRAMLAAADAKGFGARWNAALEAARAGELPAAPDFSKPTHVSGRKWLAEAVALQAAGDLEGLRGLVYDPEGSTGGALHRFVRFSIAALEARGRLAQAA